MHKFNSNFGIFDINMLSNFSFDQATSMIENMNQKKKGKGESQNTKHLFCNDFFNICWTWKN
jgi:hypothetical protein